MPTLEFTCRRCGHRFTISADYFIPGVSGFVGGKTVIDPTKRQTCPECNEKILDDLFAQYVIEEATPEDKFIDCLKGMCE